MGIGMDVDVGMDDSACAMLADMEHYKMVMPTLHRSHIYRRIYKDMIHGRTPLSKFMVSDIMHFIHEKVKYTECSHF
ncbi:hypothetical protein [Candidatus Cardinium hertigii]|jgi:hypothetical protein|uniref:Uncharacterized protein n=1 Tax=Candidatus Cardinium hertigii TaxID=247481 RepID=A0A3N2QBM1_9BACT|nr:hypothetical protein [Candidatus Cardinium hertigii]ROT47177.1 hypothetical protein EDM02_03375 [Candidatus Cardinium hertigii]ROT47226.1 hypothetical protein EDM02_03655 [Candidatus Cardinium hertigii]